MNENPETTTTETDVDPNLQPKMVADAGSLIESIPEIHVVPGRGIEVIELDLANEGPPVFDVEVTEPAIPLHVYAVVKKAPPQIVKSAQAAQPQGRLMPRIVFEVIPLSPKRKIRLALLQAGDTIPHDVSADARYVGCFVHPMHSMPIAVYEIPFSVENEVGKALVDADSLGFGTTPDDAANDEQAAE